MPARQRHFRALTGIPGDGNWQAAQVPGSSRETAHWGRRKYRRNSDVAGANGRQFSSVSLAASPLWLASGIPLASLASDPNIGTLDTSVRTLGIVRVFRIWVWGVRVIVSVISRLRFRNSAHVQWLKRDVSGLNIPAT